MPSCPPATYWGPVGPVSDRRFLPDISGMYEQSTTGSIKPATVQLAIAGQAIVGWFSPPPGRAAVGVSLQSWPVTPPVIPILGGSFVVDTRQRRASGEYVMWWWTGTGGAADPNSTDPHLVLTQLSDEAAERSGFGLFATNGSDPSKVEIKLRFDANMPTADIFTRYRASVRLPATVINAVQDSRERDLLLVEQLQPMAPKWIAGIIDQVAGAKAQQLLAEWNDTSTSPSAARKARRVAITNTILVPELEPGYLPPPHASLLRTRITAALKSTPLTIDGIKYPLWHWYEIVVAESIAGHSPADPAFTRLGIVTAAENAFAYVVDYLKVRKEFKDIVRGSIAGFSMHVRKIPVKVVLADGAWKVDDDDIPQLVDPRVLEDENSGTRFGGSNDLLIGFFVDVGVGLGMSVDTGLSDTEKTPSVSRKDLGGDILRSVTYYSSIDLTSSDFDGAWFHIASIKGPSAAMGNFVGFTGFSTTYHDLHLPNGLALSAIITKELVWEPPKLPKWDLLFGGVNGIKKYVDGWIKGNPSANLFDISIGYGYVKRLAGAEPTPPVVATEKSDYSPVKGIGTSVVFFARDSAMFEVNSADALRDGRYLLEICLATMSGVITGGPEQLITIDGFTSPEQSLCYNQALSLARADRVRQATLDAFGRCIQDSLIVTRGRGERLALANGLDDPPDDPIGRSAFRNSHPSQVAQWPNWRKAEISIQGSVIVIGGTSS
jgi:outer membrane protein OmpA-like peptidoglycan-associated protein